jgi:hypothetical protein
MSSDQDVRFWASCTPVSLLKFAGALGLADAGRRLESFVVFRCPRSDAESFAEMARDFRIHVHELSPCRHRQPHQGWSYDCLVEIRDHFAGRGPLRLDEIESELGWDFPGRPILRRMVRLGLAQRSGRGYGTTYTFYQEGQLERQG